MPFLDYHLPPESIAQEPAPERDHSRLMIVRRRDESLENHQFLDLPNLLDPGDLLVLNDTRVLPARLLGHRERTGGKWEGLYLGEREGAWELLCQTRGKLVEGEFIVIGEPGASATGGLSLESSPPVADAPGSPEFRLRYLGRTPDGHFLFRPRNAGSPAELLARFGHIPLPPYVRKGRAAAGDVDRYQTVYARRPGAIAAPTAGLHFTERVFDRLRERAIATTTLTLHVGLGTFQPLQSDDPAKHVMHREWCELPNTSANSINSCRERGGRVVAVGTTAVRTLESAAAHCADGPIQPWSGETDLFIYPPYNFKVVNGLVTNFHLPRTSLLLLVGALAGEHLLRRAYESAIADHYRFYSYGDAMLIL